MADLGKVAYDLALKPIDYPENFPWKPFRIFKIGKRKYVTDYNPKRNRNPGVGKTYYVTVSGSGTNDGLSWETPLGRIYQALQKPDCDVVIVGPGVYGKSAGFSTVTPTRDTAIIGVGNVIISNHDSALVWTATVGYTNVWQATRTYITDVYDAKNINEKGDYTKLTLQTSIDDVDANPNSYYIDANDIVYIKTFDLRVPDSGIRVFVNTVNNNITNPNALYMENINFHGGAVGFQCVGTGDRPTIIGKHCKFKYATGNGLQSVGCITYMVDSEASANGADGFNYHASAGLIPYFAEIDCIGRDNGATEDNDNGSTAHDGAVGIRVNGEYYGNKGPNVIDINDNTISLNVGVESYSSTSATDSNRNNFSTYGDTVIGSKMYLLDCYSHGTSIYNAKITAYGNMFTKDCQFDIEADYISGGALNTF